MLRRAAQRAVELGELRAQVELPGEHGARELALPGAPGEVGPALAGQRLGERAQVRVGGRVDGDDVRERRREARVGLERRPGREREAADAVAERGRALARVGGDGEHRLAGGDEVAEQPGDAAAARVADHARRPVPATVVAPGVGVARRARRGSPPRAASSPTSSIGAGRAGCAWRRTSRGSTAPL